MHARFEHRPSRIFTPKNHTGTIGDQQRQHSLYSAFGFFIRWFYEDVRK